MTKKELIEKAAAEAGVSNSQAKAVYEAICGTIVDTLSADKSETVRLDGIGTLKVSLRNARTGKNPRTGESIEIPAKYKVVLKAPDTADIQKKLDA